MKLRHIILIPLRAAAALLLVLLPCAHAACAQEVAQKPAEKSAQGKVEKPAASAPAQNPAQIELLETRYRFESNGDSRKEVHARVRINSELGVRQFARLNFDYNRSFESIEIPLVHITHASGGTADILPSAITDQPNPAVVNAPAYQDVRVKTVRILGLEPGDLLEYRVITTVSHHPLAPDFWLDHSFDRSGVVTQENFELDLPASRQIQMRINPSTPADSSEKSGEGDDSARTIYRWQRRPQQSRQAAETGTASEPELIVTSYTSWEELAKRLGKLLQPAPEASSAVWKKAAELAGSLPKFEDKARTLYDFVSQKIATIDLPVGATGFQIRSPSEILASNYATAEDKFTLLSGLVSAFNARALAALVGGEMKLSNELARPSSLLNCVALLDLPLPPSPGEGCSYCYEPVWLDPAIEVAPFGFLPASLRGKQALVVKTSFDLPVFLNAPKELPFKSTQQVKIDASLLADGRLTAKVKYTMRGDNELLLRVAFHQAPKEKWKDLAQLLSLSDGFRGQVNSVIASDPYATREPFTVEYEISQTKFVDWSKKPVRIPALLPQVGLPDPPAKPAAGSATSPIVLGTPLEVETHMTLHLPPGTTTVSTPTGTTVRRDYATFASQYSTKGLAITASRHIRFLLREIPATRATDYNAFLRAVQSDEAQDFAFDREDSRAPGTQPVAPKSPAPSQAAQPKP